MPNSQNFTLENLTKDIKNKCKDASQILKNNYKLKQSIIINFDGVIEVVFLNNLVLTVKTVENDYLISFALQSELHIKILHLKFERIIVNNKYKQIYYNVIVT